ncbi:hypothetical protein [Rhizobium sp. BK176]|uniref:hypothetical protein n=1 Tax=Rhizobium sp. BK176 TaxID=2587071 RepID=UPI002167B778|nr:hypothetical protein [Rhizobium sp. BK176]MCS4092684.1 hypothetical protein [Rhizobium sp. BK176]
MTERPRKSHFVPKLAQARLREQGLLQDEPEFEEPEYKYPGDRFRKRLRRIEEKMKREEDGE